MTKDTVVVLFDDIRSAHSAIADLVDAGIPREQISVVANDSTEEYRGLLGEDHDDTYDFSQGKGDVMETGAAAGAGIGVVLGSLGGLVVGLAALTVPGVGPVLAAGPLSAVLSGLASAGAGAAVGGVAGGLLGSLVKLDVPEEHAMYYTEGVRRGGTLVVIEAGDGMQNQVREILNRHEPVDIEERASEWQEKGWVKESETSTRMEESSVDQEEESGSGYSPANKPSEKELIDQDLANFRGSGNYEYDRYAGRFEQHYEEKLSDHGHDYVYFEPAYRYGYGLGMVRSDRQWDAFEKEVRDEWNQNHEDTWEDFKDAIRYAWEEVNKERQ